MNTDVFHSASTSSCCSRTRNERGQRRNALVPVALASKTPPSRKQSDPAESPPLSRFVSEPFQLAAAESSRVAQFPPGSGTCRVTESSAKLNRIARRWGLKLKRSKRLLSPDSRTVYDSAAPRLNSRRIRISS